jgi:hypothetical protein
MDFRQQYGAIQDAWANGTIDQDRWHQQLRDLLETAYLSAGTPRHRRGDPPRWLLPGPRLRQRPPHGDVAPVPVRGGIATRVLWLDSPA